MNIPKKFCFAFLAILLTTLLGMGQAEANLQHPSSASNSNQVQVAAGGAQSSFLASGVATKRTINYLVNLTGDTVTPVNVQTADFTDLISRLQAGNGPSSANTTGIFQSVLQLRLNCFGFGPSESSRSFALLDNPNPASVRSFGLLGLDIAAPNSNTNFAIDCGESQNNILAFTLTTASLNALRDQGTVDIDLIIRRNDSNPEQFADLPICLHLIDVDDISLVNDDDNSNDDDETPTNPLADSIFDVEGMEVFAFCDIFRRVNDLAFAVDDFIFRASEAGKVCPATGSTTPRAMAEIPLRAIGGMTDEEVEAAAIDFFNSWTVSIPSNRQLNRLTRGADVTNTREDGQQLSHLGISSVDLVRDSQDNSLGLIYLETTVDDVVLNGWSLPQQRRFVTKPGRRALNRGDKLTENQVRRSIRRSVVDVLFTPDSTMAGLGFTPFSRPMSVDFAGLKPRRGFDLGEGGLSAPRKPVDLDPDF